jgi:hypothetical protein
MADLTPQEKRGFSNEESSPVVAKLLGAMLDYAVEEGACQEADPQVAACRRAVARLEQSGPVPEIEVALLPVTSAQDFDALTAQVREAIETNRPEAGLDRLHTYVVRYIRTLCADLRGKPADLPPRHQRDPVSAGPRGPDQGLSDGGREWESGSDGPTACRKQGALSAELRREPATLPLLPRYAGASRPAPPPGALPGPPPRFAELGLQLLQAGDQARQVKFVAELPRFGAVRGMRRTSPIPSSSAT